VHHEQARVHVQAAWQRNTNYLAVVGALTGVLCGPLPGTLDNISANETSRVYGDVGVAI
jgi:hypothetical protein